MTLTDEDLKDLKEDERSKVFCLSQKKMVSLAECRKMKDAGKCSGLECFSWLNGQEMKGENDSKQ